MKISLALLCATILLCGCATSRYEVKQVGWSFGKGFQDEFKAVMLLDTQEGTTWLLYGHGQSPKWLPIQFVESESEFARFHENVKDIKERWLSTNQTENAEQQPAP